MRSLNTAGESHRELDNTFFFPTVHVITLLIIHYRAI